MPTYAYRCASCEHSFEQYQAFTDDSLTECPSCGEPTLRKVFNSIGVTFNGSGFYRTDSRSEGSKSGSGSSANSTSASSGKSSDAAGSSSSAASSASGSGSSSGSASGSGAKPAAASTSA